jgi:hypothetical protein
MNGPDEEGTKEPPAAPLLAGYQRVKPLPATRPLVAKGALLMSDPVSPDVLRAALRRGLTNAMKARDSDALAALRTAMAAIDNAEAVPLTDTVAPSAMPSASGSRIAGAHAGAGSTEAARRQLTGAELVGILRDQVAEDTREADRYDSLGEADAADRLRRQASALAAYLSH